MLSGLNFQFLCRQHGRGLDGWPEWKLAPKTDNQILANDPDEFLLTLNTFTCPLGERECDGMWTAEITTTATLSVLNESIPQPQPSDSGKTDNTDDTDDLPFMDEPYEPDVLLDDFEDETDIAEADDKGLDTARTGMTD